MHPIRSVKDLFTPLHSRGFRSVWAAQVVSEMGDWIGRIALALLVLQRTGSATLTGLALAASLLAWLGPAQYLSRLVDQANRRTVMVISDLIRAVCFGLMVLHIPTVLLLVLALLAGIASTPFETARSSALFEISKDEESYGASVALSGMTQDTTVLGGYFLGGVLLSFFSPPLALLLNALSFLLSALLLSRIPSLPASEHEDAGSLRLAWKVIHTSPTIRWALILATLGSGAAVALDTLVPIYVHAHVHHNWVIGLVLGLVSGICLLTTPFVPRSGGPRRMLSGAALVLLLGCALTILFALLGLPLASFLTSGLLYAAVLPTNMVVAPLLPRHLRASAMSLLLGVLLGWQALSAPLAGALVDLVGTTPTLLLVSLPAVLASLSFLLLRSSTPTTSPRPLPPSDAPSLPSQTTPAPVSTR